MRDAPDPVPPCPRCGATHVARSGPTHSGTPSFRCRPCGRRFVAHPRSGPIPDETKALVERSLAGRLSLRAVARVADVSRAWLQGFVNDPYRDRTPRHPGPPEESPAGS